MVVLGVNFRYIFLESYHELPPSYDTVFSEDDTTETKMCEINIHHYLPYMSVIGSL